MLIPMDCVLHAFFCKRTSDYCILKLQSLNVKSYEHVSISIDTFKMYLDSIY